MGTVASGRAEKGYLVAGKSGEVMVVVLWCLVPGCVPCSAVCVCVFRVAWSVPCSASGFRGPACLTDAGRLTCSQFTAL